MISLAYTKAISIAEDEIKFVLLSYVGEVMKVG